MRISKGWAFSRRRASGGLGGPSPAGDVPPLGTFRLVLTLKREFDVLPLKGQPNDGCNQAAGDQNEVPCLLPAGVLGGVVDEWVERRVMNMLVPFEDTHLEGTSSGTEINVSIEIICKPGRPFIFLFFFFR